MMDQHLNKIASHRVEVHSPQFYQKSGTHIKPSYISESSNVFAGKPPWWRFSFHESSRSRVYLCNSIERDSTMSSAR